MALFEFNPPDRFVAGTVGEPGQRSFFLQARAGSQLTSVLLEKGQVALLAEKISELLDELVRRSGGVAPVPAAIIDEQIDMAPLEVPIEEEFRIGAMALAWDADTERIVVEARANSDEDDEEGDILRVHLTGFLARAFVARAEALVAAGRPPCPLCSQPLDPAGHVCPRQNGYRRRA